MVMPAIDNFNYDTAAGGSNLSLTKPSNVAVGDLLMIFVTLENSSSTSGVSTPSGFTSQYTVGSNSVDAYALVYYRVADGTETSSVQIALPSTDSGAGWYMRLTGVETSVTANIFGDDSDPRTGVDTLAFISSLAIDSADSASGRDRLGFSLVSTDGGDLAPGHILNNGWDHSGADRAASHTSLTNADQYLSRVTSSSGDGGAWTTFEKTGTGDVPFMRWLFAANDGYSAISFFVNGQVANDAQVKHYDGTAFTTAPLKRYDGSAWVAVEAAKFKRWDGSSWTQIG